MATDAWHWDEVLLADAVAHGIDLRVHRPHPPGYPLLVEAAALVHRAGVDPYRSLALVGTVGGILAAAALAAFLAAAGLDADFACLGGLLYAVIPSVWLFGVRGFSDAPAAAAVFASAALLLSAAERRSPAPRRRRFRRRRRGRGTPAPERRRARAPRALGGFLVLRRPARAPGCTFSPGLGGAALVSAAVWLPAIRGSGGFAPFREQLLIQAADLRRSSALSPRELLSFAVWRRWLVDPFGSDSSSRRSPPPRPPGVPAARRTRVADPPSRPALGARERARLHALRRAPLRGAPSRRRRGVRRVRSRGAREPGPASRRGGFRGARRRVRVGRDSARRRRGGAESLRLRRPRGRAASLRPRNARLRPRTPDARLALPAGTRTERDRAGSRRRGRGGRRRADGGPARGRARVRAGLRPPGSAPRPDLLRLPPRDPDRRRPQAPFRRHAARPAATPRSSGTTPRSPWRSTRRRTGRR